jgi:hypothetical protein
MPMAARGQSTERAMWLFRTTVPSATARPIAATKWRIAMAGITTVTRWPAAGIQSTGELVKSSRDQAPARFQPRMRSP